LCYSSIDLYARPASRNLQATKRQSVDSGHGLKSHKRQ
jgi:hypothetical protein